MKTLILYATKHGATRKIAERISGYIEGAVLHDLKNSGIPAISEFDCVIIGSSVYAGAIRREAKAFISKNAGDLKDKKTGLFLSGMSRSGEDKLFEGNFPADLLKTVCVTSLLGGVFDPEKAGKMERFIMKIATKKTGYADTVDEGKIERFTRILKEV